jgi:hypothetical protein
LQPPHAGLGNSLAERLDAFERHDAGRFVDRQFGQFFVEVAQTELPRFSL